MYVYSIACGFIFWEISFGKSAKWWLYRFFCILIDGEGAGFFESVCWRNALTAWAKLRNLKLVLSSLLFFRCSRWERMLNLGPIATVERGHPWRGYFPTISLVLYNFFVMNASWVLWQFAVVEISLSFHCSNVPGWKVISSISFLHHLFFSSCSDFLLRCRRNIFSINPIIVRGILFLFVNWVNYFPPAPNREKKRR